MMSSDCLPHLLLGSDVLRPNHCLASTCQAFGAAEQLSEWHLHGASGSGGVGDGGGGNQGRMGKRLEISPVGKRGAVVSTCMLWEGRSTKFGMRRGVCGIWESARRGDRDVSVCVCGAPRPRSRTPKSPRTTRTNATIVSVYV